MKIPFESLSSIKRQIRNYVVDSESHQTAVAQVKITTARELSDSEYQKIASDLGNKFGRQVFVEKAVDPEIIGGMIVQYDDNIIDGSVRRQLAKFKDVMAGVDIKKIGVTDAV